VVGSVDGHVVLPYCKLHAPYVDVLINCYFLLWLYCSKLGLIRLELVALNQLVSMVMFVPSLVFETSTVV
jgi:hypothetical protein